MYAKDTLLEKLFYGEICPMAEQVKKHQYPETEELIEYFRNTLPEEDFDKLDKLLGLEVAETSSEAAGRFVSGFRLGFRMAMEVINHN